jgi:acyl-CoA thioester hydrolase
MSVSDTPTGDLARVRVRRRVEWIDTDASGRYHWSTALRFAEAAERVLHDVLGIAELTFGRTPRVHVEADFHAPLHFNDVVDVDFGVGRVGRSSVDYRFSVVRDGEPCAEGVVTSVFLNASHEATEPWPDEVRTQLTTTGDCGYITEV